MSTAAHGLLGNDDSVPFPSQRERPSAHEHQRWIHCFEQRTIDDHGPVLVRIGAVFAHLLQEGILVLGARGVSLLGDHEPVECRRVRFAGRRGILQLTVGHLLEQTERIFIVDVRRKDELHEGENVERQK